MLRSLFAPRPLEERGQSTTWGEWAGESSTSTPVTQTSAMQLLAVAGCVRYISEWIANLPVDVYRKSLGENSEVSKPRWLVNPTVDLTFTDWASQVLTSLLLHGNAYCVVTRSGSTIVELLPVDPSAVTVYRPAGGRKTYLVRGAPFKGELLHIKGMMLPGSDQGLSPLEYARLSIGLGLAAVEYGADNFTSSLNMPGVIEMPGKAQPETLREQANLWRRQRTGKRNRGLPGVLESGATWKQTGVTNEQAQFLETRQWTAAEIAGQVFLIDPVELGIPVAGSSIQYGNMEQRGIATSQRSFTPWVNRLETAISSLLPMPQFVKLNMDARLRADTAARWAAYEAASRINAAAVAIGMDPVQTTAEMRDMEDWGPLEGFTHPTPPAPAPA